MTPAQLPAVNGHKNGKAKVGDRLTTTTGGWVGTPPITFAFQWQRQAGGTWADIQRATELRPTSSSAPTQATG